MNILTLQIRLLQKFNILSYKKYNNLILSRQKCFNNIEFITNICSKCNIVYHLLQYTDHCNYNVCYTCQIYIPIIYFWKWRTRHDYNKYRINVAYCIQKKYNFNGEFLKYIVYLMFPKF